MHLKNPQSLHQHVHVPGHAWPYPNKVIKTNKIWTFMELIIGDPETY